MKALFNSMLVFWVVLLLFSLGAAGVVYAVWLKDVLL
jgi:predicted ABC-type exoprotein transport system permease subunit